jgi:hypothetical protein
MTVSILLTTKLTGHIERDIRCSSESLAPVVETFIGAITNRCIAEAQRQHWRFLEEISFIGDSFHRLATFIAVCNDPNAAVTGFGFFRRAFRGLFS